MRWPGRIMCWAAVVALFYLLTAYRANWPVMVVGGSAVVVFVVSELYEWRSPRPAHDRRRR